MIWLLWQVKVLFIFEDPIRIERKIVERNLHRRRRKKSGWCARFWSKKRRSWSPRHDTMNPPQGRSSMSWNNCVLLMWSRNGKIGIRKAWVAGSDMGALRIICFTFRLRFVVWVFYKMIGASCKHRNEKSIEGSFCSLLIFTGHSRTENSGIIEDIAWRSTAGSISYRTQTTVGLRPLVL